jgi:diguanylate cyclase (GGDEF)-like protein
MTNPDPEKQLTQTEEALLQRAYELAALHATTLDITTTRDLPSLLEKIVKRAIRLLNGTGGGLYLSDPTEKVAKCVVSHNIPNDHEGTIHHYGENSIGKVAQNGNSLIIDRDRPIEGNDTESAPLDSLFTSIISPMKWQNSVTGVIQVVSEEEDRKFSRDNLELLSMFANQAAIAVENTRLLHAANKEIMERKAAEEELQNLNTELTHYIELLKRRNTEIMIINDMGDMLQSCLSIDDASAVIGDFVEKLFPSSTGGIYIYEFSRDLLNLSTSWGDLDTLRTIIYPGECWGLRRNKIHQISSPNDRLLCQHIKEPSGDGDFRNHICIPLIGSEMTFGIFYISFALEDSISNVRNLVQAVSERAALAISNLSLRERLHEQIIRDPLTGLYNRRYMEKTLERELSRAIRHHGNLGLLMVDVDGLKSINDMYGHGAGDILLREIGNFLKSITRVEDIPSRFGGDEFIIVLNESILDGSYQRARSIRDGINNLEFHYMDEILGNIDVSIGVACYPEHGDTVDTLLNCAETALQKAKKSGRNEVYLSETKNP